MNAAAGNNRESNDSIGEDLDAGGRSRQAGYTQFTRTGG